MKAVAFTHSLPIDDPNSLFEVELPDPVPGPRDLLIEIEAISVNPADAKRRIRTAAEKPHAEPFIVGYDAAGTVAAIGADVTRFAAGDKVWYAGDATRPGTNATMHCVDERVVGKAPASIDAASAAALPLTGLTAWEMLFDRFAVDRDENETLLVVGGAGGVGSITIQLARQLTNLTVVATASRPESAEWCRKMGAHAVVDHRDLVDSMRKAGYETAKYIAQYADTAQHWDAMCELVAPQGKIGAIVETDAMIDVTKLQGKSAALCWEMIFTRPMFNCDDMDKQGRILDRMSGMVDNGQIVSTANQVLHGFSADTLKEAHRRIETGSAIGKLVIAY